MTFRIPSHEIYDKKYLKCLDHTFIPHVCLDPYIYFCVQSQYMWLSARLNYHFLITGIPIKFRKTSQYTLFVLHYISTVSNLFQLFQTFTVQSHDQNWSLSLNYMGHWVCHRNGPVGDQNKAGLVSLRAVMPLPTCPVWQLSSLYQ